MPRRLTFISNLSKKQHLLFLSALYTCSIVRTITGRPGCFPGTWSCGFFASRQFASKIVDLSVRFFRILYKFFSL